MPHRVEDVSEKERMTTTTVLRLGPLDADDVALVNRIAGHVEVGMDVSGVVIRGKVQDLIKIRSVLRPPAVRKLRTQIRSIV